MFLKIMGALPGYIYAQEPDAVYVNLFIGSRATLTLDATKVALRQETRYPWDGRVKIEVDPETPAEFDVLVRIPAWCQAVPPSDDLYQIVGRPASGAATLRVNGRPVQELEMIRGYARLRRAWQAGDVVELALEMPVRRVLANPRVEADRGLVALMRGPLVYCAESVDNPEGLRPLIIPPETSFTGDFTSELLGGVVVVRGQVLACYADADQIRTRPVELSAVPFYASANREPCAMRVWLANSQETAVPATIASRSRASASHCWRNDTPFALNDQIEPKASDDTVIPRFTWWDHRGTREWVQYDFGRPARVSAVEVYWWDERRIKAHCRVPESWRLLYQAGDSWKPVTGVSVYGTEMDRFNRVAFGPVETTSLRIEVQLQSEWSGGILEWKVK